MKLFGLVICLFFSMAMQAQSWVPAPVADMPMATSNNAVCEVTTDTGDYMFSFGGIDSSKVYTGIHQESFRYDIQNDTWALIDPLPDTLGKIASAASYVKGKIYIIGGYHVYQDGSELSSSRVHIFNPNTNNYEPDGQAIPVPTDDHAQVVYHDSLIYVIGGWSNTANIENVQIYNPSLDSWQVGTTLPNTNLYKFFGAQATIQGDTIFYYGGAVMGANFPLLPAMRIGVIDANNPLNINWLPVEFYNDHPLYRSVGITNPDGKICFLGGSNQSYNYNGLAYLGGTGVEPANEQVIYEPSTNKFTNDTTQSFPMDLRGLANVTTNVKYICGGMENNQLVSKKAYKLSFTNPVGISENYKSNNFKVFPNPTKGMLFVEGNSLNNKLNYELINSLGIVVQKGFIEGAKKEINVAQFPVGMYFLILNAGEKQKIKKIILQSS